MTGAVSFYFGLETQAGSAIATEVLVNGARVGAKPAGQTGMQSLAVHHEIFPGSNLAEMILGTAEIPARFAPPSPIANPSAEHFGVLKVQRDKATETEEGHTVTTEDLAETSWRAPEFVAAEAAQGRPPMAYAPHRLTLQFDAPGNTRPPVWATATPVSPQDVRDAVFTRLRELGALLAARDIDTYTGQITARYQDMARAFPIGGGATQRRAQDAASLGHSVGRSDFQFRMLDPSQAEVRTYANGRLIDCRGRDGHPFLRGRLGPEGEPRYFAVVFSMLDGRLVVTR